MSGDSEFKYEDKVFQYFMMTGNDLSHEECMRTEEYYKDAAEQLECSVEDLVAEDKKHRIHTGEVTSCLSLLIPRTFHYKPPMPCIVCCDERTVPSQVLDKSRS